jgi:hypothetical protein
MSMHALSPSIRPRSLDAFELTIAERVAFAFAVGGRRVQDLVVTFGISRNEAKRLMKVRDQLGRSCSPCMLAMFATAE